MAKANTDDHASKPRLLLLEYEEPFGEFTHDCIQRLAMAQDPLLKQFRSAPIDHLPDEPTPADTGVGSFHPMEPVESEWMLRFDDLLNTNLDAWWSAIYETAEGVGREMVKGLVGVMEEVCTRTGNIIKRGGEDLSHDDLIDMLEKMKVEVDDDLQMKSELTVVASPEMIERFESLPPPTPEQEERYKRIMQEKRERQDAQKRVRKLD